MNTSSSTTDHAVTYAPVCMRTRSPMRTSFSTEAPLPITHSSPITARSRTCAWSATTQPSPTDAPASSTAPTPTVVPAPIVAPGPGEAAGALGRIGGKMAEGKGAEAQAGEAIAEGGAAPGLGDQAFFGANQQLHVLKGDSYLAVSPPTMRSRMGGGNPLLSGDQKRAMARAIADKALSRL